MPRKRTLPVVAGHVRAVAAVFDAPAPRTVPLWLLRSAPLAHTVMSTDPRPAGDKAGAEFGWTPTHADSADGLASLAVGVSQLAA
ncbi:hypothetical protein ACH4A8_31800 [Streptomyces vietnamensis]|uniref:hypothetical protein n=1 Tax=Streptomyces vietnamensis TaxID=362257 RepID=UPI0037BC152B